VRIIDVPGGLFIDTHHKGNSVSEASDFCAVLFKRLDRETFYLLAKEMNARLWQVMRQTLAGWLKEGRNTMETLVVSALLIPAGIMVVAGAIWMRYILRNM
jgi:hypothetical protein